MLIPFSQEILIHIIDNESYEKDAVFYVELGEPVREEGIIFKFIYIFCLIRTKISSDFDIIDTIVDQTDRINSRPISPDEKIAILGKPKLGELYKCQIRIKESKEFKVKIFNKFLSLIKLDFSFGFNQNCDNVFNNYIKNIICIFSENQFT